MKQEEENLDKTAATHRQVEAAREHKGIITDTKNPTIELGLLEEEEALITVDNSGQHSKPGENGENHFDQYPVLKQPIWSVPDPGTEMPPMDAFVLSKAMIEVRAEKNVIAVTFANFAFLDFVLNWVKHLTEYEVSNILVGTYSYWIELYMHACMTMCRLNLFFFGCTN